MSNTVLPTQSTQLIQQTTNTQSTQEAYKESRINSNKELVLAYPHYWPTTKSITSIVEEFSNLENDTRLHDRIESVIGRIVLKRSSGKNLHFYTLLVDGINFQVMSDVNSYESKEDFNTIHSVLNRGDIVGAKGYIYKTKKGELSIVPSIMQLLSPCLHMLPNTYIGIEDKELRYTYRHLDLILDSFIRSIFIKRH